MTPASVGIKETTLVMGKHSGRAAFKDKLKELGYELGDNAFQEAFVRFKDLADDSRSLLSKGKIDGCCLTEVVLDPTSGEERCTIYLEVIQIAQAKHY